MFDMNTIAGHCTATKECNNAASKSMGDGVAPAKKLRMIFNTNGVPHANVAVRGSLEAGQNLHQPVEVNDGR